MHFLQFYIYRLRTGFRFPDSVRLHTYTYSSEEIILTSLMRFAYPHRCSDIQMYFPGRDAGQLCRATYYFLDFLIVHWGYLLLNNLEYWLPMFPVFADAMREKLANLPNIVTGGGRGIAAIREPIEWNYKDLKTLWKYLDYRNVLKLRNQPVAKFVFVCMLLVFVSTIVSELLSFFLNS